MYLHPLVDPSLTCFFWVSRLETGSGTWCFWSQRRSMGCAWSRNLVSNFCPGQGL